MRFSSTDAAFEGFRIARERPLAIVAWSGAFLIFNALSMVVLLGLGGESMSQLMTSGPPTDETEAVTLASRLVLPALIWLAMSIVFFGIVYAAVTRTVLRPQTLNPLHLALGRAEVNQMLVLAALGALIFAANIGIGLAVAGVAALLALVGLAPLAAVLALTAPPIIFLWLLTRFSLAGPMTFDSGRLQIFASWAESKGRFWPMLGAYLLAFVLALIVTIMIMALSVCAAMLLSLASGQGLRGLEPEVSLASYFRPAGLVTLLIGSIGNALTTAITIAVGASIHQQITRGQAQPQA
jgi:hypothetical protein